MCRCQKHKHLYRQLLQDRYSFLRQPYEKEYLLKWHYPDTNAYML